MIIQKLYRATDNLIDQQFYLSGKDIIIGRTPDICIKIRQSGQIIKKFKNLFNNHINLFLEGNYLEFFSLFKKINGITDEIIQEIYQELRKKLNNLEGTDIDIVIIYTMVLSTLLSRIRELHFNIALKEVKRRVKSKSRVSDEIIQKELDKLFMKNNRNVSILYNLTYICALSESFNYKKVSHVCRIQKSKYINHIVELIYSYKN
ncbi:MAG: hypothetical protein ACFFBP_22980 [Promethearchaeota archaeon]